MTTLYCPKCGYNLTGLTRDDCPECGERFSRAELEAIGGIKHPSLARPLLWLLVPPGVLTGLSFLMFSFDGHGRVTDIVAPFLLVGVGACVLAGLVLSIIIGRRIARRLSMRPPKSRPNFDSVALTLILALVFFCAQLCVAFFGFFAGCVAGLNI